jgi:hypothetical protein
MDSSFFQFNDLKARKIFSFFLPCLSDPIVRRLKQLTRERRREEIFLSESLEIIRWSFHRDILRTDSRLPSRLVQLSKWKLNWTCLSVCPFVHQSSSSNLFSVFLFTFYFNSLDNQCICPSVCLSLFMSVFV